MKRDLRAADTLHAFARRQALLRDLEVEDDVELLLRRDERGEVLAWDRAVERRAVTGAKEGVVEVLADDGVLAADGAEHIHAGRDLGVAEQRAARHRAVPVAVESRERQNRAVGVAVDLLNADAAEERERQPEQRADAVPEIIARAQSRDERLDLVHPRRLDVAILPADGRGRRDRVADRADGRGRGVVHRRGHDGSKDRAIRTAIV